MESTDDFQHATSVPPDDRDYHSDNVTDQGNYYEQVSPVLNDSHTYDQLYKTTAQWVA